MRSFCLFLIFSAVLALSVAAQDFPAPSATFEASQYTKWQKEYKSSRKALIDVEFVDSNGASGIYSSYALFAHSLAHSFV